MTPPKSRSPWSDAETATLRNMRAIRASVDEIASALGRTRPAVEARIKRAPRIPGVKGSMSGVPTYLHPDDPGEADPVPRIGEKTRRERDIEAGRKHLRDLVRGYPNTARRLVALAHTHVHVGEGAI